MTQYRYRAWDGTQSLGPFTPDEAMDALAEALLDGSDLRDACCGTGASPATASGRPGLRDLLERARQRRERALRRRRPRRRRGAARESHQLEVAHPLPHLAEAFDAFQRQALIWHEAAH